MPARSPVRRAFLLALVAGTAVRIAPARSETAAEAAVADRARRLLAGAGKGRAWTTGRGVRRWPVLVGGSHQGTLWEDVEPRLLQVGDRWQSGSGWRIELVHDGRIVGMLWLDHE